MKSVALVILAAGASIRFGSAKQLADIDGKCMLQHVLDNCGHLNSVDIYLVLGAKYEEIQAKVKLDKSTIIINPDWQEGMGSSIRTAALQLQSSYDGILFVAGDQPFISSEQLARMVDRWSEMPDRICAAHYGDTVGIPAIFPRNLYSGLFLLEGDLGAKQILLEHTEDIQLVEIPQAAMDIDRSTDLDSSNPVQQ